MESSAAKSGGIGEPSTVVLGTHGYKDSRQSRRDGFNPNTEPLQPLKIRPTVPVRTPVPMMFRLAANVIAHAIVLEDPHGKST